VKLCEIIDTYLRGRELGDGELSLGVTARGFHYDDPDTGRIARGGFVEFAGDFKRAAVQTGGEKDARPFLACSEVVIDDHARPANVWYWWQAVGTNLQGCARDHSAGQWSQGAGLN